MKSQTTEKSRWNEANLDTLFHSGAQSFVNQHFGQQGFRGYQNFDFNLIQQPVNMVTGYQRQHRKSVNYVPTEGADSQTTDQYTRLMTHVNNAEGINEQFSKACELSAVSGMVLMQPYLDYTSSDPAQGSLKLKVWEYNSFIVDPYFRNPDMSDANYVWCQEYISKKEAEERFPDQFNRIRPMSGQPQRYGNFYFLPENYNMATNDLMVISYVWYKSKRKKKKLYSRSRNQFFDFSEAQANLDQILYGIPDLQVVEVDSPTWKLCVGVNDQLMFKGNNPLGFDDAPMVPVFWNYDPHNNQPNLRVRSLVRPMRSSQFLMSRQILISHDQKEATINAGWKRKSGAVANEDNLKKSGQGWDVIINEGYEMTDAEKILPTVIPESDFALADRMQQMIFATSGVNMESWTGDDNKQLSGLTLQLKQAANLLVLQKYFDQWDYALKLLGNLELQIVLNNWNAAKVGLIIGEDPTPWFYSHIFAKYQVLVEEGLNTPTQRSQQAQQLLEINQIFGREVFPPSFIIKDMNLSGRAEAVKYLESQEEQASHMQQMQAQTAQVFEEAKLKKLYSEATKNIAQAREAHGRNDSNIGLFEERLSMIGRNRATATKDKVEALNKLMEAMAKYGEVQTMLKGSMLEEYNDAQAVQEDEEKVDAKMTSEGNKFVQEMLSGLGGMEQRQ